MRRRLAPDRWPSAALAAALAMGTFLGGCAGTTGEEASKEAAAPASTASDVVVFFRTASIESVGDQGMPEYPKTDPGDATRLARDVPDAPPQIPHSIEDMYPITLSSNDCLDCHLPENATGAGDVSIPKSHFKLPVMGKGPAGDPMVWVVKSYRDTQELAGTRYNCNMCHTPQATNVSMPLNRFEAPR